MTAAAGAAAAAMANAVKAYSVVVRVEPHEFMGLLKRVESPLIVVGAGGVFRKRNRYLTTYKGLAFFTESPDMLVLPSNAEIIAAKSLSIPDM
jgi:hypothetical protein